MTDLYPLYDGSDPFETLRNEAEKEDAHDEEQAQSASQIVTFLVDVSAWLQVDETSFQAIKDALVSKILDIGFLSHLNTVGVVLYGAETSKGRVAGDGDNNGDSPSSPLVFWWSEGVVSPTATFLMELASLTQEELRESVGNPVPKTQIIEGFGHACSEAETTAKTIKKKTKAEPVFVVVTGDPDPQAGIPCPPAALQAYHDRLASARNNLRNRGFVLVAPMAASKGAFSEDSGSFWATLQKLPAAKNGDITRDLSLCHVGTIRKDLDDWWPVTKPRRARKMMMRLGNGVAMHVQARGVMQCTALAKPEAKLPPSKWFDSQTMEEVVANTKYIHPSTGEPVEKDTISTFALDLKESASFSNVLAEFALPRFTAEELSRGTVMGGEAAPDGGLGWQFPCLNMLEFYPLDTLTLLHQNDTSAFVTHVPVPAVADDDGGGEPAAAVADPGGVRAAAQLFHALWLAMKEQEVLAVGMYKGQAAFCPHPVALVVQEEAFADTGEQVQPSGFSMHTLPYTDEIRIIANACPCIPPACLPKTGATTDPPSLPAPLPPPPEAAVAAAAAMVEALADANVSRFQFKSPENDFTAAVLRSQVLDAEMPDRGHFNSMCDYLTQQAVTSPLPLSIKEAFLTHAMGGHRTDPGAATAGKKRAAAPKQSDADVATLLPWKQLRKDGQVKSKSMDVLKQFLAHHKAKTSGKKAELVERAEAVIDKLP